MLLKRFETLTPFQERSRVKGMSWREKREKRSSCKEDREDGMSCKGEREKGIPCREERKMASSYTKESEKGMF